MEDSPVQQPIDTDLVNMLFSELKDSETIQAYKELFENINSKATSPQNEPNEIITSIGDQLQPAPSIDSSFYTQILEDLKFLSEQGNNIEQQLDTGFKGFTNETVDKDLEPPNPSLNLSESTLTEFENVIKKYFDSINTQPSDDANTQQPPVLGKTDNIESASEPTLQALNDTIQNSQSEPQPLLQSEKQSVFETKPFNTLLQKINQPNKQPFTASVFNNLNTQPQQLFNKLRLPTTQDTKSFNLNDIQKLLTNIETPEQTTTFNFPNNQTSPTEPFSTFQNNTTDQSSSFEPLFNRNIDNIEQQPQNNLFTPNNLQEIQTTPESLLFQNIPALQPQTEIGSFDTSLLETASEIPSEDTWSNVSISDPALQETANNTATTNELLKQLTQAILMLAGSSMGNTGNMPPPPIPNPAPTMTPSMGGQAPKRLSESVPVIPSIRGEFI